MSHLTSHRLQNTPKRGVPGCGGAHQLGQIYKFWTPFHKFGTGVARNLGVDQNIRYTE